MYYIQLMFRHKEERHLFMLSIRYTLFTWVQSSLGIKETRYLLYSYIHYFRRVKPGFCLGERKTSAPGIIRAKTCVYLLEKKKKKKEGGGGGGGSPPPLPHPVSAHGYLL
uniref:Uncharacterized protein n=1 Tax=Cacopsylla melanoneura TaxID=428564 RepID=A0A8D9ESW8_9HEMI